MTRSIINYLVPPYVFTSFPLYSLFFSRRVVADAEVENDNRFVAAFFHHARQGFRAGRRVRRIDANQDHVALRQRLPSIPTALRVLFSADIAQAPFFQAENNGE